LGAPALLQYHAASEDLRLIVNGEAVAFVSTAVTTWYFVVITYDGAGNWTLDRNNSGSPETITGEVVTPNSESGFLFGNLPGTLTADVALDSWGVWARLLTADEKTALYNSGSGKKYSTL
jgi:hypothetical protein